MPQIHESPFIKGVLTVHLRPFVDERGQFVETFRKEWFPFRSWDIIQSNRSDSVASVLRGLHFHKNQVDYWHVSRGSIRAGLVDLRLDSPSYLTTQTIDMHAEEPMGLYIPIGVAHGFLSLTDCTLNYIVDNYYDSSDEYGVAWNDPQINLDWGTDNPTISQRDRQNPLLEDLFRNTD